MFKKILPIIILMGFVSGTAFAENSDEPKILTVLNSYFDAWKTRDINEIGKMYADEVSVYDLPSDYTTKGKDNVLKYEQEVWLASAPDMVWVRTSPPLVSGNSVTYEWIYAGTYSGMWGKQNIIAKPFSVKGISTTTINDAGKIIWQKDFYDLNSFESQLGI